MLKYLFSILFCFSICGFADGLEPWKPSKHQPIDLDRITAQQILSILVRTTIYTHYAASPFNNDYIAEPTFFDKQPMTVIIYDSSTLGYAQYLEEPAKELVRKINTALGFNKLTIKFTTKKPTKLNDNEFIIYYGTNSDKSGAKFPEAINFIYSLCGLKRSGEYHNNDTKVTHQIDYGLCSYYKITYKRYFLGGIQCRYTNNENPNMYRVYGLFSDLLYIVGFEQDSMNLYDFDTVLGDNCYNYDTEELNVKFSNFDIIIMRLKYELGEIPLYFKDKQQKEEYLKMVKEKFDAIKKQVVPPKPSRPVTSKK